jgi:hypothetical protein
MPVPISPIPAPGFKLVSGKSKPTEGEYHVQFRNSLVDEEHVRRPDSLRWIHIGCAWDVVAVKRLDR